MKSKEVGFSTRTVKVPVQKPSNKLRRIGFRNSSAFCLSNSIFFITAIMLNMEFEVFSAGFPSVGLQKPSSVNRLLSVAGNGRSTTGIVAKHS